MVRHEFSKRSEEVFTSIITLQYPNNSVKLCLNLAQKDSNIENNLNYFSLKTTKCNENRHK